MLSATLRLYAEWGRVALGRSHRPMPATDWRFADPAWREHPLYRRLALGYLAFCDAADELAEIPAPGRGRARARLLTRLVTSSLAPSNTLLGNPAALKRAFDTAGSSLVSGLKNLIGDLVHNQGMPSQIDSSAFKVGRDLAVTPGAVVFRNEMVELLQYQPTTPTVCERPTLMIPPPIGKYYFMDLAPKRSFVEHAVSGGVPMFVASWRNPGPEHGHWRIDDYIGSCLELVDAVCDISGTDRLNLIGMCAGGIFSALMLCVMAARDDKRVAAATFGVTLLDFASETPIGAFNAKPLLALAQRRSSSEGVLPAADLARVFAWMRPNDLVWNYWVNNYLMGKAPPSFDILAWSADGTNLPACLHAQFLAIFRDNLVAKPGALTVLGVPIDLATVRVDSLVTGALTDHLTPWKACYRATQLLGGSKTFVLSNAGHIASLVNPPGNPKASYWTSRKTSSDPDAWLKSATQHSGTWWELWAQWSLERSGAQRPASNGPGSARYPALCAAPGEYVLQEA